MNSIISCWFIWHRALNCPMCIRQYYRNGHNHPHPISSSCNTMKFPGRGFQWMGLWTKLTRHSARGSWFDQILIITVTNPMHGPHCKNYYHCHFLKQLFYFPKKNPKQVTSEWGSYLRSYKLDQDIFPGDQLAKNLMLH